MQDLLTQSAPILEKLKQSGYPGYLVGGSVRDALMGRPIHDLDMTTAALPHEVKEIFSSFRAIDTGLLHGTITLLTEIGPVEITTFRTDGTYTDHRRPDQVQFTTSLEEDLSRRDFTMNAIALGLDGLHDPFHGQSDIQNRIIRCVGDAETRFTEDALRILRGLRFAATLGFSIAPETAVAIHRCAPLLAHVSAERRTVELISLLCGDFMEEILLEYSDVITTIIPELASTIGFDQRTHYHSFDIYTHIVRTVKGVPPTPVLRLAALLHDIAKPQTFRLDEQGVGHFYRHAALGAPIAQDILKRLRLPNATIQQIVPLVALHGLTRDTPIPKLPKLIAKLGEEGFFNLLSLDCADSCAKHPHSAPSDGNWLEIAQAARTFLDTKPCLTAQDLTVNGQDAMAAGLSGKEIGIALQSILNHVLDGQLENQREPLLEALNRWRNTQ